ncbi:TerC family protein [Kocuria rhizophila]|nr:TerC family protein [Kocuria rhizophila]
MGLLAYDFIFHARKPHEPTVKEAAMWTGLYVSLALLFGSAISWTGPPTRRSTTPALSRRGAVRGQPFASYHPLGVLQGAPRGPEGPAVGIVVAPIARCSSSWARPPSTAVRTVLRVRPSTYTAGNLVKGEVTDSAEDDDADKIMVRLASVPQDHGRVRRRQALHPGQEGAMLLVMVAIGLTDIMFALELDPGDLRSDPGDLHRSPRPRRSPLMGLRQPHFLIDGLLDRPTDLSWGSGHHLGLHRREAHPARTARAPSFINDGEPVHVGRGDHRVLPGRDRGRAGPHGPGVPAEPQGSRGADHQRCTRLVGERFLEMPESAPVRSAPRRPRR